MGAVLAFLIGVLFFINGYANVDIKNLHRPSGWQEHWFYACLFGGSALMIASVLVVLLTILL